MKRNTLLILCMMIIPLLSFGQDRKGYNHHDGGNYDQNGGGRAQTMGEAGSALTVFSENGDYFYLMINGIKQNMNAQTRVRVEMLPMVTNDIEIVFDDNSTRAIRRTINFVDPIDGQAINLTLKIVRERDGDAKLRFYRAQPLERGYHAEQNEYVMSYGRDNHTQPTQVIVNTPPPPPPVPVGPSAMDNRSFDDAVQAIKGAAFDESKLSTAKTIANSNYFTTDQVITICQQFAFDDSKLNFAKYAFKKTLDNSAYYKVNSVFSFDSDKQALNDYVNKNR